MAVPSDPVQTLEERLVIQDLGSEATAGQLLHLHYPDDPGEYSHLGGRSVPGIVTAAPEEMGQAA